MSLYLNCKLFKHIHHPLHFKPTAQCSKFTPTTLSGTQITELCAQEDKRVNASDYVIKSKLYNELTSIDLLLHCVRVSGVCFLLKKNKNTVTEQSQIM